MSEPPPKKLCTDDNDGPDLVIHLDLNKTILAVDEVKEYGKIEVCYLEQWKNDEEFLKWAYIKHGPDFGDVFFQGKYAFRGEKMPEKSQQDKSKLECDAWIADLKLSKNEPTLIAFAQEYCGLDKARQAVMEEILAKVDEGNCVKSFWKLCDWAREQELRVLICFRTFGCDIPAMYRNIEAAGYGEHLVRDKETGRGQVWTVLHKVDAAEAAEGTGWMAKDVVQGHIQPGNPVPGPKMKGTEEFKTRTVKFEEQASERFKAGRALEPVVYTGAPPVEALKLQPFPSLDQTKIHPVTALNSLLAGVQFSSAGASAGAAGGTAAGTAGAGTAKLRIMGMQDNYKPWSRKNPLNGKVCVLDGKGGKDGEGKAPFQQLLFDDYSFTKGEEQGTYIWAIHDSEGKPITGNKTDLQARYSAEAGFVDRSAHPCIFTVVLNKKGQTDTSVHSEEYFTSRVQRALAKQ